MIPLQGKSRIINYDETLRAVRDTGVTFVNGKPIKNAEIVFEFKGNVQPMGGHELILVPEGDRFKEQYWIWTAAPTPLQISDTVVRCNINYEVQTIQTWGSYSQVRIMRLDVGPNATP